MLLFNPFTHDARVLREARTLAGAGHEVTVFARSAPGLPGREERDGFRVERLPAPGWTGWTGVRRAVPLLRWYGRTGFLAEAAAASRPEVVHGHDLETLLPAGRLARRLGVPHVHDDHELGLEKVADQTPEWLRGPRRWAMDLFSRRLRRRGATLEAAWIPRAAAVVAVSDRCAAVLEERYGVRPVVLRNLPERSDLPPDPRLRERAGLPPGTRVALCQGTMTAATAPEACVAAARHLPPGWAVVFLGTTWLRARLEALAREEGVADRVRFLDPVPPGELPGYTRAADVGLTPVRILNEAERGGLSNKLFEYLHAGLPVVTTEGTAQAEVVREEDAGVAVPAENAPGAIAAAVRALGEIPEAGRRARAERLRAAARERWCWEVEAPVLRDLYARITSR